MSLLRNPRQLFSVQRRRIGQRGVTLTELLVASLLTSLVILIGWGGLVSALNMSNIAQAKTARKVELTRAMDLITSEIREAQAINQARSVVADGGTVSVADVVASAGVNLEDLGNYGEITLYLELPTEQSISTCPGPAGADPVPADRVDRVVYDVRPSPSGWLAPNAIARYGRIPDANGTIHPCSTPVASDIVADAIAQTDDSPACGGVLSGSKGFHTCIQGEEVALLFQSAISDVEISPVSTAVTPRSVDFNPPNQVGLALQLERSGGHHVILTWTWHPSSEDDVEQSHPFNLKAVGPKKIEETAIKAEAVDYKFDLNKVSTQDTDTICFQLGTLNTSQEQVNSNRICTRKKGSQDQTPVYWEETSVGNIDILSP